MGIIEDSISELVFAKTDHWNFSEITLSGKKIFVLSEINGKTSLKTICIKLKVSLTDLKNIINELGKLNLIKIMTQPKRMDQETTTPTIKNPPGITGQLKQAPVQREKSKTKKTRLYRGVSYDIA